ncbi:ABC transporter substrate-binding protein [Jiangella mangrovi]|uniref:Raffinose/stachyose/melibiose transport system substrate-binding protein n=1 Tax=Jiangella mangrovi TaxID=1524084 RepID=A0A7W9GUN6_9ACTN|nr:extracellular solute-binding protein [Jiangella mangrovi]MBB5790103.1 raffinose/stachyose/melibiose transport system substrate-binding protein [Jiangella mangrovi]
MSRGRLAAAGLTAAGLLAAAACGPAGGDGDGSGDADAAGGASEFSVLSAVEAPYTRDALDVMAADQCAAENEALPLANSTVPQADVTTRASLLASQDALPVLFPASSESVRPDGDLVEGGLVVDYEEVLTELGIMDDLLPSAVSAIKKAYDGRLATLPFQFNIEGIFYNKQIFAEQGIEVPTTFGDLLAVSQQLQDAGIQPFSVAGATGWPATRWISTYLFRDVGPDAMEKVRDGEAKLTDPEYVAAAQAIADMGAAGFFGEGVGSIDYDTSRNQFATGEVAMMYGLTSLLSNFNDPAQTPIGSENVGLMSFPEVEGGAGSIEQFPANAGTPMAMSAKLYDDEVGAWLTCITANYGSALLADQGGISGFVVSEPVADVPPLTQDVQTLMESATDGVLWFEALFDEKSRDVAKFGVAQLITGDLSPADYMASVQESLDAAG